jgi:glycosyltransferase involved in cell wall biosynthesis
MPSTGIVVPAYRPDCAALCEYVEALQAAFPDARIRVELDAASDATAAAVLDAGATANLAPERRGKGAAVTAGFEALDTDVYAFADADGSTTAASLADVVGAVADGGADLAVGSRRHPDATVVGHQTVARRFLGDGFAWLAGQLLAVDLYDYQCGAKAISAAGWERVRESLHEAGFAWDVELVAIAGALGLRVEEVPITWKDQPGSTVSPVRTPVSLLGSLLDARHRAKRLRDSRLHEVIAAQREDTATLVDRETGYE